ncbi:MAG: glutamate 5-kinase [Candidatus Methylomirabilia bacterium]
MGKPNRLATRRSALTRTRRLVVKVGSGLLASPGGGLNPDAISALADELARVMSEGREVVLVSSGAIAAGVGRLGLKQRPRSIPEKQAAAAVGQSALIWHYEQAFARHGLKVAQVLLIQDDISHRTRYLNARNTLSALLAFGILPIVNENDTVAVDEIKVGDNDNLSALVAHLIDADLLVLLTDVDGLYSGDPRREAAATRIEEVEVVTEEIRRLAWDDPDTVSVGGMGTKLQAAEKAVASGIPMVIAGGRERAVLQRLLRGESVGTLFLGKEDRLAARKRWIAFAVPPQGRLTVDAGARKALGEQGRSLLPSGLVEVDGNFQAGEMVALADTDGKEFGRGLVNYDSEELNRIRGVRSTAIEAILGYKRLDEAIHRDNLVVW